VKSLAVRACLALAVLAVAISVLLFIPVPALDYRFGWSTVPPGVVAAGDVLVAVGFYLIVLVYRENTYTSATIEVTADQKVVSTGPYAIVRHPMYASALLYLVGTPLALGSYLGLVPLAALLPFLMWRLFDEERFLAESLPGYVEYQRKVRHRLIPRVW
jgi:protein-S-isoprenylcysteine O-methyltransferase Ste14